jgi:hypothetical protein
MRTLGSWDEEEGRPYGLPKIKVVKIKKRIKKKKEDEAALTEGEGVELGEGAEGAVEDGGAPAGTAEE